MTEKSIEIPGDKKIQLYNLMTHLNIHEHGVLESLNTLEGYVNPYNNLDGWYYYPLGENPFQVKGEPYMKCVYTSRRYHEHDILWGNSIESTMIVTAMQPEVNTLVLKAITPRLIDAHDRVYYVRQSIVVRCQPPNNLDIQTTAESGLGIENIIELINSLVHQTSNKNRKEGLSIIGKGPHSNSPTNKVKTTWKRPVYGGNTWN